MLRIALRQTTTTTTATAAAAALRAPGAVLQASRQHHLAVRSRAYASVTGTTTPKDSADAASVPKKKGDGAKAAAAAPAPEKPTTATTPAPNLAAQDKAVDDALNEALLQAIEELKLEDASKSPELKVQGYEGPILPDLPSTPNPLFPLPSLPLPAPTSSSSIPTMDEQTYHATLIHGRSLLSPMHHPTTYSLPAASLHLRSHSPKLLDFYIHFALHAAASLGIPVSRPTPLPTERRLWTVPRSPFAHKKSQENFERRTHKRVVKAWDAHPDVVDVWLAYLRKHALGGVGVRVTRWERLPLGVGAQKVEGLKGRLLGQGKRKEEEVKKLAGRIVEKEAGNGATAAA